jgi:hypothetical protein
MRYAAVPIGKPAAFSHSPYSAGIGTLTSAVPPVTVADETTWNASGIRVRVRRGRWLDDDDEAVRDCARR